MNKPITLKPGNCIKSTYKRVKNNLNLKVKYVYCAYITDCGLLPFDDLTLSDYPI